MCGCLEVINMRLHKANAIFNNDLCKMETGDLEQMVKIFTKQFYSKKIKGI